MNSSESIAMLAEIRDLLTEIRDSLAAPSPRKQGPRRSPERAHDRRGRPAPLEGTRVIWPKGLEKRYGISAPTRWRWERDGQLPARDVFVGGCRGWKPSTLEEFERVRGTRE